MEAVNLESLLDTSINKLGRDFPEFKKIGAFNIKNYYLENMPTDIFGSYNLEKDKICINSFIDGRINEHKKELFDTILHEEAHLIERKFKNEPFRDHVAPHSIYWFGIYKRLGGNLNGFYVRTENGGDILVDFSILNYHLNLLYILENNYDSKIKALATDFKKSLLELISNATVMDLSGSYVYKERLLNEIYSSGNKNPILIFEQETGFNIVKNGRRERIKINYDFEGLKGRIEYL
jgi:hypothetical protein